jgi:hypothetical protein
MSVESQSDLHPHCPVSKSIVSGVVGLKMEDGDQQHLAMVENFFAINLEALGVTAKAQPIVVAPKETCSKVRAVDNEFEAGGFWDSSSKAAGHIVVSDCFGHCAGDARSRKSRRVGTVNAVDVMEAADKAVNVAGSDKWEG